MSRSKSVRSLGWLFLMTLLACVAPADTAGAPAAAAAFPVRLSSNGRTLVDQAGSPFLITGDSPWYMTSMLTKAESDEYLENRRVKGFNTILTELVIADTGNQPPPYTRDGNRPFTTPNDFSTPNEAYFAHADWVISKAAEKGILVLLAPCWFGYGGGGDGWWNQIIANGPAKCRGYGRYLGSRYRNYANIVWVHGGDYSAPSGSTGELNGLEILLGIRDQDPAKLHTFHRARVSTALQQTNFAPYLQLDATYSGDLSYPESLLAYNRANFKPHFLLEGRYEGSQAWDGKVNPPWLVRYGAYGSILSGSTGQMFASNDVYEFGWRGLNWRAGLEKAGSFDMIRVKSVFGSRAWYQLVPDQSHTVVTGGYGTYGGTDFVPAARTADGALAMAYLPSTGAGTRSLTVDLGRLSGSTTAKWYNPTNGAYATVSGSPFANSGSRTFTTPGDNGTGTNDWLLVLEAGAAPPPPPPSTGPVGYWKLDGNGSDSSGNGNSATPINGAFWTTGKSGSAAGFDGVDDCVSIPDSAALDSVAGRITLAAWVYRNAAQTGWTTIANRQRGTGSGEHYFLGFRDSLPEFWIETAGGEQFVQGAAAIPAGLWAHVAGTYDGATLRLYVNGTQVGSAAVSGATFGADSRPLTLGASQNDGTGAVREALNGRLDEVRLYNRALPASEIQGLLGGSSFGITVDYVSSGKVYSLSTAQAGALYYTDRSYTISSLSAALNGQRMIRVANDDKLLATTTHLKFTVNQPATVYVCYDPRASQAPGWLSTWTLTGETFAVADGAGPMSMRVYSKAVPAGQVTLGGNLAAPTLGAGTNYALIVKP